MSTYISNEELEEKIFQAFLSNAMREGNPEKLVEDDSKAAAEMKPQLY